MNLEIDPQIKINTLIKKTEGLSIRAIEDIIKSAKTKIDSKKLKCLQLKDLEEIINIHQNKPKFYEMVNLGDAQVELMTYQRIQTTITIMEIFYSLLIFEWKRKIISFIKSIKNIIHESRDEQ